MQNSFKRYCKAMELLNEPILIEAYKKAHAKGAAWTEITQGMKEVGIIDMEIYLLGTKLFMIMDTTADFDHDKAMAELALKPRQSEWEAHMSQFQDSTAEATADQKWELMDCIYKMD
ncbi:L-rhamnose mutarotase [Flavobacterium sp. LAR06]|uniref:L-rhamnose mutarotase n=1 Tax=Flavobacterium sp. LAR06 TaxID=3064897 RepID=UPI0035C04D1E